MKLKGLYRKTDSGIWYYQPPMVKGVRPRAISLKTKNKKEAVEAYFRTAEDARREFSAESIQMEAARFLKAMLESERHTERTSEEAAHVLKEFAELHRNPPTGSVQPSHVIAYRDWMQAKSLSPATVKSKIGRLSGFFSWALREGLLERHPCHKVELPRNLPTRSERYCTKEERDRLIKAVDPERKDLELVLWLGFFAGMRKNEIIEARRDWIDLAGGVLHIKRTETFLPKGKKNRIVRMSPRLTAFLKGYMEEVEAEGSGYLLRPEKRPGKVKKARGLKAWRYRFDPQRAFDSLCQGEALSWVTFHTMRHTFATLHAIAGTPLSMIAKELGDDPQLVFETYVGYTRHGDHAGATD